MFARYFVELPISPEEVERALSRDPRLWLPGLAERANHRGDMLLAEVGFGEAVRIKRTVVVELGPPVRSASKTVFALRWAASGAAGLFPSLDADLEVAPVRPSTSSITSALAGRSIERWASSVNFTRPNLTRAGAVRTAARIFFRAYAIVTASGCRPRQTNSRSRSLMAVAGVSDLRGCIVRPS